METETKRLIPLMLINDKSKYVTHENSDTERKVAANELGECLKKAMADCYANNTITKEAYISNIQKYISGAKHKITFEPNMEITIVDQYGRPWSEVKSNSKEALTTRPINLGNNIPAILDIHNLQKNEAKSISEEQLSESERQEKYADIVEYGRNENDLSAFKKYVEEHGSWLTQEEKDALYEWWKEVHSEIKWWQYIPMVILAPLMLLTGCSIQEEPAPELKSHKTEDKTETETKPELDYKVYVTAEQMEEFGWPLSAKELKRLNEVLERYRITNDNSIALFLATCAHESGKGTDTLEDGDEEYFKDQGYTTNTRGAGYMQITGKYIHNKFLSTVSGSCPDDNTASYIAKMYPWESAAWFWTSKRAKSIGKKKKRSLNKYIARYYKEEKENKRGVYLMTQYAVNGWPADLPDEIAEKIRDGKVNWRTEKGRLYVNGIDICRTPNGWDDTDNKYNRENVFNEAISIFE